MTTLTTELIIATAPSVEAVMPENGAKASPGPELDHQHSPVTPAQATSTLLVTDPDLQSIGHTASRVIGPADLTAHRLLRARVLGGVINEYRYAA